MRYLAPIPLQFVDESGVPCSGGTVSVHYAGNNTLAPVYENSYNDELVDNPVVLDSFGMWKAYVDAGVSLDYIVKNDEGNVVASYLGVVASGGDGGGTGDVTKAYVDENDNEIRASVDNLAADVADEVGRAEAAEKAAKTEVIGGENVTVEETIAPDGHSIFSVSSDGAPQVQADWNQQDQSEPDYIYNKPTKLSEFTDDITKQSLVESGVGIEKPVSSAAVNAGLSEKADKVQGATASNLAALDANGNLTDSGKKAADFATDEQGAKADTAVQGVKVNGTELSKDVNNVVDVPVPTASTATPLKDGTASAGSSTQWARGDHRHPTDDSREAVANKVQSIDDSSTTEYPSSKAVADFVNSSVATNTATFLGNFSLADLGLTYPATEVQIASALNSHTWPEGYPTNNDYVYVEIQNPQSTIDDKVQRYKYRDGLASWGYEYTLNNSSFTAEEKAAIDSGITSQDVTNLRADHTTLGTHVADTSNPHQVTAAQVGAEPAFSVLPVNKGGTSGTTKREAAYNIFSDILHISENISDNSEWIQGVGSPSSTLGPFCRNKILNVWVYIQNKISSVLGLTASSYGGNAATATSATTAANYASGGDIDTALQGKSSTSHTHSVKINGTTKTIAATGGTAVDLGTYLTSHQSVTDSNPTLSWGTTSKVGTVGSTDLRVSMPANPASGKLDTNGDGSNVTAAFTAANTRANISTGDKLSVIFGKIAKWFADLKSVAWSGSYNDLSEKPNIPAAANNGILTITQNGSSKGTFGANQSSNNTIALTDTTYESKSAASGGTDVSLCTTGEKYTWNGKQNTVGTDTDSSAFNDNTTIATGFGSNKIHFNIASRLWTYIQGKISSVIGLTAAKYNGAAATNRCERGTNDGSTDYDTEIAQNTAYVKEMPPLASHSPNAVWNHLYTSCGADTGYAVQLTIGMTGNEMHIRHKDNGIWTAWLNLRHAGTWFDTGILPIERGGTGANNLANVTVGMATNAQTAGVAKRLLHFSKSNNNSPNYYYRVGGITSTMYVDSSSGVVLLAEFRDTSSHKSGKGLILLQRGEYATGAISAEFVWLQRFNYAGDSSGILLYYVPIADSSTKVDLYVKSSSYSIFNVTLLDAISESVWEFESSSTAGLSSLPSGAVEISMANHYVSTDWGTSGQYLKSNGIGTAPSWENPSNLSVGTTQNVATQGAASSSNSPRHVWFSDYLTETKRAHDDNLNYTPSTNTLSANISGSAAKVGGKKIVVGTLGTDTDTIYFLTGA